MNKSTKIKDETIKFDEQLLDASSMYCRTPNAELEVVVQHVTSQAFEAILEEVKKRYGNPDVTERLDVAIKGSRYSISDKRAISEYVIKGTVSDYKSIKAESKKLLHKIICTSEACSKLPFVINLKLERPQHDISALFEKKVPPSEKHIRYMKRFSKIIGECRIDMSVVRSATTTSYRIKDVQKDAFKELYEIEVEHVGDKTRGPESVAGALMDVANVLTDMAVSLKEPEDAENDRLTREYLDLLQLKSFRFAGPNPVTLEKVNLLPPDVDIVSIKDGTYVVTEKADGVRAMLLISSQDLLPYYLTKLSAKWTLLEDVKSPPELGGSLLDCELVENVSNKKLVLAFDIFAYGGTSVAHLPLGVEDHLESRSGFMDTFASSFPSASFRLKRYRPIEKACDIIEDAKLGVMIDYSVDGLIYMPSDIPIGGNFPGDVPKCFNSWGRVFKWKPPDQNSIDFLVDVDKERGVAYLYSEWAPESDAVPATRIGPLEFYSQKTESKYQDNKKPRNNRALFEPCPTVDLKLNHEMKPTADNGDVFRSGDVVEFSYDLDRKTFLAMRVRKDREDNRANSYRTAMQIWKTIHDPVTLDHVCGRVEISESKEELTGDTYWRRDESTASADLEMNIYHRWMKEIILSLAGKLASDAQVLKRGLRLLDMGCGKAGDLSRWRKSGIVGLLGIDFFDDSITNSVDGAFARLTKDAKDNYVFARYDASLPLTPEGFEASPLVSEDEVEHRMVLRAAFGLPGGVDLGPGKNGVAMDGFEIVSSMFTLHYFYDTEEKLDGFVDNVGANLLPGGVFVGCCFAAEKVLELLDDDKLTEGRNEDGKLVWQISETPSTRKKENDKFGREIEVYVDTINHKIAECLVDFDMLKEKLSVYSIELVEESLFDVAYEEYLKGKRSPMSDAQKRLSFLYRYFVFQRRRV